MTVPKEIINIKEKEIVKPDLFGQLEQLNKKYEEKFLKEIHPLIKKFCNITGKDFVYEEHNKVIIKYELGHYWVLEGNLMNKQASGLWFDEEGCDIHGRKFGGVKYKRDGWFSLITRLCCQYEKEIKQQIENELIELMK